MSQLSINLRSIPKEWQTLKKWIAFLDQQFKSRRDLRFTYFYFWRKKFQIPCQFVTHLKEVEVIVIGVEYHYKYL